MEEINRIEKTYRRLKASGQECIRLFAGNPNDQGFHFPVSILGEAYGKAILKREYHPHPKGLMAARSAIAAYYDQEEVPGLVDPENILITSGTSESFWYIFLYLAKPFENVVVPSPSYPLFDHILKLLGIEARYYTLDEEKEWSVDMENLNEKIDSHTKAIVLISPHNPTGKVLSFVEIHSIVKIANRLRIPIICDEVFSQFCFDTEKYLRPAACSSPWLCFTLNGISKMLALPGYKLSWIWVSGEKRPVADAVDALETTADTFLSCGSSIQEVLPTLLANRHVFVRSYVKEVQARRDLAVSLLGQCPKIEFVEPRGGFYLMAKVKMDRIFDEENLVIKLMEKTGVYVHPGYFYDYEKGIHFVMSFLAERKLLSQSLRKITDFVSKPHRTIVGSPESLLRINWKGAWTEWKKF